MKFAKICLFLATTSILSSSSFASRTFFGVSTGFVHLNTDVANEENKSGTVLGVKILESFRSKHWFLDPALGYQFEKLDGKGFSTEVGAAFGELSLRYAVSHKFTFGLMSQYHFAADNTRSEVIGSNSQMLNGGLHLVYHTDWPNNYVRLESSVLRSITGLSNRELYSFNLGFSISLNEIKPKSNHQIIVIEQPVVFINEAVVPEVIESLPVLVAPAMASKDQYLSQDAADLKIALRSSLVGFKFNSSELDERSQSKIGRLADYLVSNDIKMKQIQISGHTDSRGSREHNLKLSKDRANSVKKVFQSHGVLTKIKTYGYGFSRPIDDRDSAGAYEKNRRTEIEFIQVVNQNNLVKEINSIISDK